MDCRTLRHMLVTLIDGDLKTGQRIEAEMHLEGCPACQAEYEALRRVMDDAREFVVFPGKAYRFEELRARMRHVEPLEEIVAFIPRMRVRQSWVRFAMGMAVLVVVSGGLVGFRETRAVYAAARQPILEHRDAVSDAAEGVFEDTWDPRRNLDEG